MTKRYTGQNVYDAAVQRMIDVYAAGHTVVCSFSAGKDSGVCVEVCIAAARETGRLPVTVIMRDEEIMFPGTFEYAERTAARDEVDFHWIYCNQPIINIFNRRSPYFWTFDPTLDPEQWVRKPPDFAYLFPHMNIENMVTPQNFPHEEGKETICVLGLRVSESPRRRMGLHSSGGYLSKRQRGGYVKCRPIYDWADADVWKGIHDFGWDYNDAYDVLHRMGVDKLRLRIAPPTLTLTGLPILKVAAAAWPRWFDRVAERLPGTRSSAQFGKAACTPYRRVGETWEACFRRTCIEEAPDWIAARAQAVEEKYLRAHGRHSTTDFPEVRGCRHCSGGVGLASWKKMAEGMYNGDPFCMKQAGAMKLPFIEPEFFREGAGTWGGTPQW